MTEGWIKLHRKIWENKYWLEPRRFSKAEAWIDIMLLASHKEHELIFGNTTIYQKKQSSQNAVSQYFRITMISSIPS